MHTQQTLYQRIYPEREIFSISELNNQVKNLLENQLGQVWLTGEISNFTQPASGHMYFSLKDSQAQVRCAMFRGQNMRLGFAPQNGVQVLALAKVSLYEPRGDYQLIVEYLEESGEGLLRRAFEELKKKLHIEGLFNPEHKKHIPRYPTQIGVITSATGAAFRDIISVSKRRMPSIPLILYSTSVQGQAAAAEICQAIALANEHKACEVLILARGGGSLEDLWPFNEEIVARAIFNSQIPIVSGVGHEIDFTMSDFVADQRAPTPSAAAETVCPNALDLLAQLQAYLHRFSQAAQHILKFKLHSLEIQKKSLKHPQTRLQEYAQQLDFFEAQLIKNLQHILQQKKYQFGVLHEKLNTLNPIAILQRGYAICFQTNGKIVSSIHDVKQCDEIKTQLADGEVLSKVLTVFSGPS